MVYFVYFFSKVILMKNKDVFLNHELKIQQCDGDLFKLIFQEPSEALVKSITKTKIIVGATITNNYKNVIVKATSLKTLKQFMKEQKHILDLHVIVNMILTLSLQLSYLIDECSKTFIGYHPDKIIVIDDNKFIYMTNELLIDIVENDKAIIRFPFSKDVKFMDFYMAPELSVLNELPAKLNFKLTYYSLGCLITYCSLTTEVLELEQDTTIKTINYYLDQSPVKGTKIYWLLKRCLDIDCKNRCILFV
jgi:hypothetical protein